MKYMCPLISVTDMERSKEFYRKVLGLRVTCDLGANVTLTGGMALQTDETWREFIESDDVAYGGSDGELYFEEDDFDAFTDKLATLGVTYVHPVKQHPWGQRVVRFRDPDGHIIEVGENLAAVCRRFLDAGLTPEAAAQRMGMPVKWVLRCVR